MRYLHPIVWAGTLQARIPCFSKGLRPPLANRQVPAGQAFRSSLKIEVSERVQALLGASHPYGRMRNPACPAFAGSEGKDLCRTKHSNLSRINTSKSVSKQTTLTIFRMNTYGKQGRGVP